MDTIKNKAQVMKCCYLILEFLATDPIYWHDGTLLNILYPHALSWLILNFCIVSRFATRQEFKITTLGLNLIGHK